MRFREILTGWALRHGNGYAEIERDELGRPIALHPLHPSRVVVVRNGGALEYDVDSKITLAARDMFHIAGFGEGVVGLNVAQYAAESIGYAKAVQLFGASWFGHGSNPSGIVKMKNPLSLEGMRALEERFREIYGGPSNANKVAFLDNEMDFQSVSVEPEKGQFIETNFFLIEEVCRWFGVPPHKIFHLLRATFSNIEHQSIEVVVDSIKPWSRRFCDEADRKLLGNIRFFSEMDFSELLRGDSAAQVAYWKGLREMGAVNANEVRRRAGLSNIGPDGDKYIVQANYTTLERVGAIAEPPPPTQAPAPPQPASNINIARFAAMRAALTARLANV
jgi:HK97 family phage portal protein